MNSKQIFIGLAGVVIAGVLIAMQVNKSGPRPLPPDPTPVIEGIAQVAMNDHATFGGSLTDNTAECARKIKAGEIKTTDAALKWWKDANDTSRYAAYQMIHDEFQKAVSTGDVLKLGESMEAAAPGFRAAIKGQ